MAEQELEVAALTPVEDGAVLEVENESSFEAIRTVLEPAGWTVTSQPIWPRFEFYAPASLSGPEASAPRLTPQQIVEGLMRRNRGHGLPAGSIRLVSSSWEAAREGHASDGPSQRLRIYVDVSPEGVEHLRAHSMYLCTLLAVVRLRPNRRSRRDGRKEDDKSSERKS